MIFLFKQVIFRFHADFSGFIHTHLKMTPLGLWREFPFNKHFQDLHLRLNCGRCICLNSACFLQHFHPIPNLWAAKWVRGGTARARSNADENHQAKLGQYWSLVCLKHPWLCKWVSLLYSPLTTGAWLCLSHMSQSFEFLDYNDSLITPRMKGSI